MDFIHFISQSENHFFGFFLVLVVVLWSFERMVKSAFRNK